MRFLAVFLLAFVAFASLSIAVDISACTNLAASTSYRLTGSITNAAGTCMNITGNSVTLDMNGFTIDGANTALRAAFNATASGVTGFILENGTVQEWDSAFREVGSPSGWRIQNVTFLNLTNTSAASLFSALSTSQFINITVRNTTEWEFSGGSNINITNSSFFNCIEAADGKCIEFEGGADNARVVGLSIINASHIGLDFSDTTTDNASVTNTNITNASTAAIRFNNLGTDGGVVNNVLVFNSTMGFRNDFSSQMNISNVGIFNTDVYVDSGINVTNISLGYNLTAFTNWTVGNFQTPADIDEGVNVRASTPNFIAVNDSSLPALNTTAVVKLMSDAACTTVSPVALFRHTELPSSKGLIMSLGSQVGTVNCTGGIVQFTPNNFTNAAGYAPYIVWLGKGNETPSSGSANVSTILYITFYDEASGAAINIDSAALSFNVTNVSFLIQFTGVNATQNATIRAYPDFITANISSIESYAKSDYTSRTRFMVNANTTLNVQQNVSIFFLSDASAAQAIINVVDRGEPVPGVYVTILKYFAATSIYTQTDQKITNSEGQLATLIDPLAYYKFLIVDADGNTLFLSSGPEQIICGDCEITIDISGANLISVLGPYTNSTCVANYTTNFVTCTYLDQTGRTSSVNLLIYRQNSHTPAYNNTISAASAQWIINMTDIGENLTAYWYQWEIWRTASPASLNNIGLFDGRILAGIIDAGWVMVVAVIVIATAAGHIAIGVGLAGAVLPVLTFAGLTDLGLEVTVPIMVVMFAIAFLLARRSSV